VLISIIMANYKGATFLPEAIASVLSQTHSDLEIIICDDASPDASVPLIHEWMTRDSRIQLVVTPRNAGPAAARNCAISLAKGDWLAIMDSDDLIHPHRLERLVAAALLHRADIIADDLVYFGDSVHLNGQTLMQSMSPASPFFVDTELFLQANGRSTKVPAFGYLKPLIRRSCLGEMTYDETLKIGEDYDLVLRLLLNGARYAVVPDPMYLYRRHKASVSHRISAENIQAMLSAIDRLPPLPSVGCKISVDKWCAQLAADARFESLAALVRAKFWPAVALRIFRDPRLIGPLWRSIAERLGNKRNAGIARMQRRLILSNGPESQIVLPSIPPAGAAWSEPPGRLAAHLTDCAAQYNLTVDAQGVSANWAKWLIPQEYMALLPGGPNGV
jgi:succinoglycan biosynthesis protein ExoO